ncbi:PREDICTED: LOW QUALITY PROTEIN: uncharacterized protein LOC108540433 [Rhinopithecus bieti]|uniref:LOW QUALITY PROTEIN: uncharacterized protein LOC108540433 n=1 Tax=Rhinopithecus bieti TaxID=61621 RepID=UPI00083C237F|nr:PREDICTED: LOW QUALITY PROTEIN: uncharacterized protein LOC108540433 [Rhinopithecus bieti]
MTVSAARQERRKLPGELPLHGLWASRGERQRWCSHGGNTLEIVRKMGRCRLGCGEGPRPCLVDGTPVAAVRKPGPHHAPWESPPATLEGCWLPGCPPATAPGLLIKLEPKTLHLNNKSERDDGLSPGLQLSATLLSNLWTLSSDQSCRIRHRTYSSALGRGSLKKSPGLKTKGDTSIRYGRSSPPRTDPRTAIHILNQGEKRGVWAGRGLPE